MREKQQNQNQIKWKKKHEQPEWHTSETLYLSESHIYIDIFHQGIMECTLYHAYAPETMMITTNLEYEFFVCRKFTFDFDFIKFWSEKKNYG